MKLKKQLMNTNSTIKYLLNEISNIKAKHESDEAVRLAAEWMVSL